MRKAYIYTLAHPITKESILKTVNYYNKNIKKSNA